MNKVYYDDKCVVCHSGITYLKKKHPKSNIEFFEISIKFKKGFIRAETVSHNDFIKYKGFNECKIAGKLRLEGKDYIIKDGEVLFFRVNN